MEAKTLLIVTLLLFQVKPIFSQCETIEKIQEYKNGIKITRSNTTNKNRIDTSTFNINAYMKLYPALKKEPAEKRKVFDCYYFDNFFDGKPHIYIRNKNFNLIKHINKKADKKLKADERNDFIQRNLFYFFNDSCNKADRHIVPDDTEEGYIQYLYFCEFGELFALKWHASYKEKEVICTKEKIAEIVKKYTEEYRYARTTVELDENGETIDPIFECDTVALQNLLQMESVFFIQSDNDSFIIKWLEIEKWWGIFERTYQIMRKSPYRIELMNEKHLVNFEYNFIL